MFKSLLQKAKAKKSRSADTQLPTTTAQEPVKSISSLHPDAAALADETSLMDDILGSFDVLAIDSADDIKVVKSQKTKGTKSDTSSSSNNNNNNNLLSMPSDTDSGPALVGSNRANSFSSSSEWSSRSSGAVSDDPRLDKEAAHQSIRSLLNRSTVEDAAAILRIIHRDALAQPAPVPVTTTTTLHQKQQQQQDPVVSLKMSRNRKYRRDPGSMSSTASRSSHSTTSSSSDTVLNPTIPRADSTGSSSSKHQERGAVRSRPTSMLVNEIYHTHTLLPISLSTRRASAGELVDLPPPVSRCVSAPGSSWMNRQAAREATIRYGALFVIYVCRIANQRSTVRLPGRDAGPLRTLDDESDEEEEEDNVPLAYAARRPNLADAYHGQYQPVYAGHFQPSAHAQFHHQQQQQSVWNEYQAAQPMMLMGSRR
ncbi:MAG: hypothetical protein SGCHY_004105 [Lobulomycetales sp.]